MSPTWFSLEHTVHWDLLSPLVHGFYWFLATAALLWHPSAPERGSGFTFYCCLQQKIIIKKNDKNLRGSAEVSSSATFVPAVNVWISYILGMQWVLQEVQMVSSVSCHPLDSTLFHLPKHQSSLEFMFNQQFWFQGKMSRPHWMIIYESVYATSQMNSL